MLSFPPSPKSTSRKGDEKFVRVQHWRSQLQLASGCHFKFDAFNSSAPSKNVIVSLPMIMRFLLTGCSVIKSDVFAECHPVVSPNKYFDACRHETCLCHQGGDCGCFCSAVANYARACNQHGISVIWRREGFCGKSCR